VVLANTDHRRPGDDAGNLELCRRRSEDGIVTAGSSGIVDGAGAGGEAREYFERSWLSRLADCFVGGGGAGVYRHY